MESKTKKPATAKRAAAAPKPAADKPAAAKTASRTSAGKRKTVAAAPKPAKMKKPKLVRDSFTIPKDEYGVLDQLKLRAATLAHPSKKSELLRAGIKALSAMADKDLLAALQAIPSIRTGRPKKA